jgi:hypothetical protein
MPVIPVNLTNDGHNLIKNAAKNIDKFIITSFAIGSSNAAIDPNDHALHSLTLQKAVAAFVDGASVGEVLAYGYIGSNEAVGFDIEEVGILGGISGNVLIARGLWSHPSKTNLESVNLIFDLTG